ncbi:MAG: hypothetical protein KC443_12900 [Anaerolineales bacterium]|nr:hypothetical protein [Anaerolineales bacterium]
MFEWEILYPSAIELSPYNDYEQEIALYGDRLGNGQAVFDLFIEGEWHTELYWASVSLGVPGGSTMTDVYEAYGDNIERFLYSIIQINIDRHDE